MRGTAVADVAIDPGLGRAAVRDDALLATLARAGQIADLEVEVSDLERDELRDPQAGRIEELEHRAVPESVGLADVGSLEQTLHLVELEIAREATHEPGGVDLLGGIGGDVAFGRGESIEAADGGGRAGDRAQREPVTMQTPEEVPEIRGA